MSPYLPITPDEIASESIAAAEAGATIIHLHARDPETGRPTASPDVFKAFLPRIKQSTGAVVNISTGGAPGMTMDERRLDAWAQRAEKEMNAEVAAFMANGLSFDEAWIAAGGLILPDISNKGDHH